MSVVHDQHTASIHQTLTIARLLQERLLRMARVTGGADVLDRQVDWCLPWDQAVVGGQLDGMLVYAHADQIDPAGIAALELRNAAGVVVTNGTPKFDVVTSIAYIHSDADVSFADLSRLVAELTLAREAHVLRYGLTVHRTLADLLYRGAGLSALCREMAVLSRCAVGIFDTQFRVLAFDSSRHRALDPTAIARALSGGVTSVNGLHPEPAVLTVQTALSPATLVSAPIVLSGTHEGWVVVVESSDPPHPHDVAEHRVVVEQAATIIGTQILRMRSVEEAEERARGDFVHALLHGRFANTHDLEARAAHYKFPTESTYSVLVAGRIGNPGVPESVDILFQLARDVTRLAVRPQVHTLAAIVGDVLAVIREIEPEARHALPEQVDKSIAEYATALELELGRRLHRPVLVTYGRPVTGALRIFASYRDARIALGLRDRLHIDHPCGFSDLRVYAALTELAGADAGRAFANDLLAPLRGLRGDAGSLEEVVIAYIRCGGNLNAAARELHVHRNTMLYKLDRASRLLQLDLRQAEHQFAIWLAYKLRVLNETTTAVDRDLRPR